MMLVEVVLHILQQGPSESTLSFETFDQVIMNISKDINATTNKFQTQKWKKLEAKPNKTKADVKTTRKEIMKKRIPTVESSSSFNNDISLPLSEEELYTTLEATPKND